MKQSNEAGKPAWKKQEALWISQDAKAAKQLGASTKSGMGAEHQFPHWYSQVGAGGWIVVLWDFVRLMRWVIEVTGSDLHRCAKRCGRLRGGCCGSGSGQWLRGRGSAHCACGYL